MDVSLTWRAFDIISDIYDRAGVYLGGIEGGIGGIESCPPFSRIFLVIGKIGEHGSPLCNHYSGQQKFFPL